MKGFNKTFYLISCAVMAVILVLTLCLTIYLGVSGQVPKETSLGNPLVLLLLIAMGALTVLCLCLSSIGGRLPYKIGFYLLHGGLAVLIVGFVLTNLTSMKCYGEFKQLKDGGVLASSVEFQENGVLKKRTQLSSYVGLESVSTEYYENGQPKHYEAVLTLRAPVGKQEVDRLTVTVNNPVRIDGMKFYLMSVSDDGNSATFLIKSNPGEYVVIAGAVILMVGTFVMCFSDGFSLKRLFKQSEDAAPLNKGKKVKRNG